MNTKNLLVSFVMLVAAVFLMASVTAAPLATITNVEVDGMPVTTLGPNPSVSVGDVINVRVEFTSLGTTSDVTVKATFEGNKKDTEAITSDFDVETGQAYGKTLRLDVPFDLKDSLSDVATLTIKVKGSDGFVTETSYALRLQRESYSANIISVSVPQTAKAGDTIPVDVVLKNIGYNDLDELFVTAKITALGIERTSFFGDLVAIECDEDLTAVQNYGVAVTRNCNEDDQDTVSGRLFLQVPYSAKSGTYTLELSAENDDTASSKTVQVVVNNAFSSGNFIASGNQLLLVNPTNEVVVYRIIPESTNTVAVSVSDSLVAVPAGSSKSVTVTAYPSASGTQIYSVNVFTADGKLVDTVGFTATSEERSTSSPIVVLTIILAIIFVILLVVLMVLIGKKPEKTEEFGESYY